MGIDTKIYKYVNNLTSKINTPQFTDTLSCGKSVNLIDKNDTALESSERNNRKYIKISAKKSEEKFTIKTNVVDPTKDKTISKAYKAADAVHSLEELYIAIKDFEDCQLKKFATNTVICDGVIPATVMIIGEAPGTNEDAQGIPFCGDSGKLLDLMLSTIGLSRKSNVYITNTVFWRPPANRKPTNMEIESCKPFLEKHIALIKPKLLLLAGSTAISSILGYDKTISTIRGKYFKYINKYCKESIDTTAIFHPAYLLRQPARKKDSWFDLLKIKNFLK
ncbi:uracil-DNA glycosylase [Candidatus Sneabacter namystus]|uniref:Type-4 uracil-DNA glycosylase n=2 Tax=Candidatus Sneabacter namystus TaxID=2601646 RepID=A0A5C0UJE9_9RICK|nr:uracil-DNA glycosylase [Candidatus Sneabacter namystus]